MAFPDLNSVSIPQHRTTDGVIGTSGKPTVLTSAFLSSTAAVAQVDFHDAAGATNLVYSMTVAVDEDGVPACLPPRGLSFPNGCYVNVTNGVVSVGYQQAS